MKDIIMTPDGNIDWNANGWPEPNAEGLSEVDGYSTNGMPNEVFDEWQALCWELDWDWTIDG